MPRHDFLGSIRSVWAVEGVKRKCFNLALLFVQEVRASLQDPSPCRAPVDRFGGLAQEGFQVAALLAALGMVRLVAGDPLQAIFEQAAKDLSAGAYAAAGHSFEKVLPAAPNQVAAIGNFGVVYPRTHRPEKRSPSTNARSR